MPMAAIVHDTASGPNSPWVAPGTYEVRLIAGGKTYSQPFMVRMDPRVATPAPGIREQSRIGVGAYELLVRLRDAAGVISDQRARLQGMTGEFKAESAKILAAFETIQPKLSGPQGALGGLIGEVEQADFAPSARETEAFDTAAKPATAALHQWDDLVHSRILPLNARLKKAGQQEIALHSTATPLPTVIGRNQDED